jgi:hypothetical protein
MNLAEMETPQGHRRHRGRQAKCNEYLFTSTPPVAGHGGLFTPDATVSIHERRGRQEI